MTDDIKSWLAGIGLEKYAAAFEADEVLVGDLVHLSEQDLKDLGLPLGPRRRLQSAVAGLQGDGLAQPPSGVGAVEGAAEREESRDVEREGDAQRRQLTVMFVDLVGSTDLSRRIDVEDLQTVNRAYQEAAARGIARFGGTVAKYMGDGILAYFGYPIANEDDAERAVHAGLAIIQEVGALELEDATGAALDLAVRVGIATGMVVVGDLIGEGTAQERAVVGETPNLAARVETAAAHNAVAVAPCTYRLTRNLFEYESLGAHDLKGFDGTTELWQAHRPIEVQSRFHAMRAQALSPLIGRADEIALLQRRWRAAADGEGHAVVLSGEAGIGKSRLTEAVRAFVETQPHHLVSLQCSPHHASNPFYPLTSHLLHEAQAIETQSSAEVRERIAARLRCADQTPILTLFGGDDQDLAGLAPNQRKERMLTAFVDHVVGISRDAPVLCLFEDIHWADASSLEVFDRLLVQVERHRVLCVMTHRPEFRPRWVGQAGSTLLTLGRMGARESRQLAEFAFRNTDFSQELIEQISERADGIPLFIEELTQSALETSDSFMVRDDPAKGDSSTNAIPETLLDTLMARLDRSPEAREVAQVASVIGRDFDYAIVEAVINLPAVRAREGMDQLVETGLLQVSGELPGARCRFKHALVCDAAYGTLTRNRKAHLHGAIAGQFERSAKDQVSAQHVVIAYHYGEAGEGALAITWFEAAGKAAMAQSAFEEAAAIYERAIALCETLRDESERTETEFRLQATLGLIYSTTHGYASEKTEMAYLRALALSETLDSDQEKFRIQLGLRTFYQVGGRGAEALPAAKQCLDIAERTQDDVLLIQAHVALGHTYLVQADFAEADHHLNEAEFRYDPAQHAQHLGLYGLDPGVFGHGIHAQIRWFRGQTFRSSLYIDKARELSERLGHVPSVEQTWNAAAHCYLFGGRASEAHAAIGEALAIARKHGFSMRVAMGSIIECVSRSHDGSASSDELALCIDGYENTGGRAFGTFYKTLRVGLLIAEERYDDAIALADQTIDEGNQMSEHWWASELHRLKGVALAQFDEAQLPVATHLALKGADIAAQQGAKTLELRALCSHAQFSGMRIGTPEIERLRSVFDACDADRAWPDIVAAEELLTKLASR